VAGRLMLILVSSNSRAVYAQNILDLTAQPEGAIMHFRYSKRHVHPELWKKLSDPAGGFVPNDSLSNARTFSVFFDQSLQEYQPEDPKAPREKANAMYAVRSGTVQRIYRDASVAHVFYRVGRYLPLAVEPPTEWKESDLGRIRFDMDVAVNRISDKLKSFLNWNSSAPRYFLQEKTDLEFSDALSTELKEVDCWDTPKNSQSQQTSWEKLVWTISMSRFFARTVFFRAGRLYRTTKEGKRHFPWGHPQPTDWTGNESYTEVPIVAIRPWIQGWRLRLAVSHRLELYTFQSPIADSDPVRVALEREAEITVTVNEKLFVSDGPGTRMSINYDSHPFDFQPVFGEADSLTKLKVTAFPEKPTPVDPAKANQGTPTPPAVPGKTFTPYEYGPRCPQVEIWIETVHNVTYLERAAKPAAIGTALLLAVASDAIVKSMATGGSAILSGMSRLIPCTPPWTGEISTTWLQFILRVVAALLLIRSFVIAVRKLPTPKI